MLLMVIVCVAAGVAAGLYVGLLIIARGKAAGVLCVDRRSIVVHQHVIEHRVLNLAADESDTPWTPAARLVETRQQLPVPRGWT